MIKTKHIIYLLGILILASHAFGIGVAPSKSDTIFYPSIQKEIFFRIINNENKDMEVYLTARGSLAQYISFENEKISMSMDEFEKIVKVKLNLPEKMPPGQHTGEILIVESNNNEEGNIVMASIGVIHKVTLKVPYPDEYIEGMLFISEARPQELVTFTITLSNLGVKDIKSIKGQILIRGPDSRLIGKVTTNEISLKSTGKSKIVTTWTANVDPGTYHTEAIVEYDGKLLTIEKDFDIGEPLLEIQDLRTGPFKIGNIAKFDIILKSRWNQEIRDVYGLTEIMDNNGVPVSTYKTSSVNIPPLGLSELYSYWDTNGISPGKFVINVKANYFGRVKEKSYELDLKSDKINVKPLTGEVIKPHEKKEDNNIVIIIVSILGGIILVKIVLDFIVRLKQVEKKSEQKIASHPELRKYVITKIKQGYSREAIKSTLIEKGWPREIVEKEMIFAEEDVNKSV